MAGTIRVVSRQVKPKGGETVVPIDRSTVLGNPFKIGKDGSRREVVVKYGLWLICVLMRWWNNPQDCSEEEKGVVEFLACIAERVRGGENVALLCWCAPEECHGDMIRLALDAMVLSILESKKEDKHGGSL